MEKILEVEDLQVSFSTHGGTVQAVRGVSFQLNKGETLAIVGESGCGKSVTSQSIMQLLPASNVKRLSGSVRFKGTDILKYSEKQMRKIRGSEISMISQDPMTGLNPTLTIGNQLLEVVKEHQKLFHEEAVQMVVDILHTVGIPSPHERMKQYPHQFSGGMRQRIMIAMALICNPEIIIADEPTTALDVTIQAQIFELFKKIQRETGVSIILITHDLGVVAQVADRIAVMYAGKIVETGTREEIFYNAEHPYTRGLLNSVPRLDMEEGELIPIPGTPPDLFAPPPGCPFTARCPMAMEVCSRVEPFHSKKSASHSVYCWLQDERAKYAFLTMGGRL
ncbi:dipeptide transport ATP-binding protein DppD [Weizmannia acidilactici]|uniref:Dipeptide transport ATP-binding protein DppD n=1 Tax=Weizmannia acidilactici TaxID=2607726 RepID=A0A5J4JHF2_9BACI|nr:ABC transporter ATP-binding protein [Weizmannia acidilactici]GER65836.1 dipeptide transport ATP-binding protein DppD [Weizmannia acidilactici]GER69980.1 dipeptide transport ATP-binding protein DppD [Weizmannia acidilactici]GER73087.1 dipeptide transport ATP-binding protein DppD [Weizmannia acidilactici]